eukprot:TRINITY_DN121212_c0_g1_i1.p1 TRINITY_DN121212_c0_g1~~TRINITY_DN121212_c0_g1_i1.p1  ORF type:complete len:576 (+),score=48.98 TRINITY_DN121212_c0_g1_i1:79-1806(+)
MMPQASKVWENHGLAVAPEGTYAAQARVQASHEGPLEVNSWQEGGGDQAQVGELFDFEKDPARCPRVSQPPPEAAWGAAGAPRRAAQGRYAAVDLPNEDAWPTEAWRMAYLYDRDESLPLPIPPPSPSNQAFLVDPYDKHRSLAMSMTPSCSQPSLLNCVWHCQCPGGCCKCQVPRWYGGNEKQGRLGTRHQTERAAAFRSAVQIVDHDSRGLWHGTMDESHRDPESWQAYDMAVASSASSTDACGNRYQPWYGEEEKQNEPVRWRQSGRDAALGSAVHANSGRRLWYGEMDGSQNHPGIRQAAELANDIGSPSRRWHGENEEQNDSPTWREFQTAALFGSAAAHANGDRTDWHGWLDESQSHAENWPAQERSFRSVDDTSGPATRQPSERAVALAFGSTGVRSQRDCDSWQASEVVAATLRVAAVSGQHRLSYGDLAAYCGAEESEKRSWHSPSSTAASHALLAGAPACSSGEGSSRYDGEDRERSETEQMWCLYESEAAVPSVGSAGHAGGDCRPCAHFWKPDSCNRGELCERCHLCPPAAFLKYRKAKKSLKVDGKWSRRSSTTPLLPMISL